MQNINKHKMWRLTSVFALVILIGLNLFSIQAKAAEVNLPFNTKVEGLLTTAQDSIIYKIQVTKAGRVTFDINSFVDSGTYIKLSDSYNNVIFDDGQTSSSQNPAKYFNAVDLEAGNYFLEIYDGNYNEYTGKFNVTLGFTPANNNEFEPNNGTVQAQPLSFNTLVNGYLSWNDKVDVYKITVPKSGRVSIDLSSFVDKTTYVSLIDNKNNIIIDDYINSSSINPAAYKEQRDLEPGTYYLKIFNGDEYSINTGKYQLKVGILLANSDDKEPNNGTVNAQPLAFSQQTSGFLSWNDSVDVYKITVPKSGRIYFDFSSYIDTRASITLLDSFNKVIADDIVYGSSANPGKFNGYSDLSSGTYYLKVENDNYYDLHSGKYFIKISAPHLLAPLNMGLVSDKTTVITGKTSPNLLVTLKVSDKLYKKSADTKGNFKFTIPKQKVGSKIEAFVTNGYGTKKVIVKVVDKTPPGIPTVNRIADNQTVIKGKTEPYAIMYAKVGKKQIGYGKANAKGYYTIKISKQKAGTSIKVYARDKAKNIGPEKTVKVLDKTAPYSPRITDVFPEISGNAEKGSTVYIYNGKKLLGKQKVTNKGEFSIGVKAQKKGSTLKVYARDKAGNKSRSITIRIK
ncbi:Ig-like domain-containing protein [Mesobacillus subterraneus]|nr:Ig-like domain-containing protein [Mesobacillus subterraneus]